MTGGGDPVLDPGRPSYGCGDVILGLNPASDDLDTIVRLERLLEQVVRRLDLPTRYCVLSDIIKQREAQKHTRVDVGFQSLAGTSRALAGMVGLDADGVLDLARSFDGLYFETGQGSAVTNGAAMNVDMVTLEARAYGLARPSGWTSAPLEGPAGCRSLDDRERCRGLHRARGVRDRGAARRACLEDTVMAKLHGLTMGLDVCATFHMGIAPWLSVVHRPHRRTCPPRVSDVRAGNADPMLATSPHPFANTGLRHRVRRCMTSAMEHRLTALGVLGRDGELLPGSVARLYAMYARAGGDPRTSSSLEDEGHRRVHELRERGFDLGAVEPSKADARLDTIYTNARSALYATLDDGVIRDATVGGMRVRTTAANRDDYLAHPPAGERLREEDARAYTRALRRSRPGAGGRLGRAECPRHQRAASLAAATAPALLADGGATSARPTSLCRTGAFGPVREGGLVGATIVVPSSASDPGRSSTRCPLISPTGATRGRIRVGSRASIIRPRPRSAVYIQRVIRQRPAAMVVARTVAIMCGSEDVWRDAQSIASR